MSVDAAISRASAQSAWQDALAAARLFAADPEAFGGIILRAAAGPVRDRWLAHLRACLAPGRPVRKLPLHARDDEIIGGLDLVATLNSRQPVARPGILAEADGGVVLLAMAERLDAQAVAHICAALDQGTVAVERDGLMLRSSARIGVVALDEGDTPDEATAAMIAERCAFRIDLGPVSIRETAIKETPSGTPPDAARDDTLVESLCAAAFAFGIESARAPLFALRAARMAAQQRGGADPCLEDMQLAARLVFAPRAVRLPPDTETPEPAPESGPVSEIARPASERQGEPMPATDLIIEAARTALPPGLLAAFEGGGAPRTALTRSGAGARRISAINGRPAGVRRGMPGRGARLSIIDTLRSAAPLQRIRRAGQPQRTGIVVGAADLRIRRFIDAAPSTTIFIVDASGSAALERLAEAKGAIELLLANAHVRRAEVALIAFRGTAAEICLPPTRSLVRAKRTLAGLAGGGGTPLAAGLEAGRLLAASIAAKGRTVHLVLMTDGRANVTRAGTAGRVEARSDAMRAARLLRELRCNAAVVDIGARPSREAAEIASAMAALYAPLPGAGAQAMFDVVRRVEDQAR